MLKIIGFLTALLAFSCAKQGEGEKIDEPSQENQERNMADAVEQAPSLSINFSSNTRLDALQGYLVGFSDTYVLKRKGQGSEFVMPLVESGQYKDLGGFRLQFPDRRWRYNDH